jgi:hypothetical protein
MFYFQVVLLNLMKAINAEQQHAFMRVAAPLVALPQAECLPGVDFVWVGNIVD